MQLSFIVNHIYINGGWSPASPRVGGSEECVIHWAKLLQARGHDVQVFHNGEHGVYDGVRYKAREDFEPGDVTINVNDPEFKTPAPSIYYTTLDTNPDLDQFSAVACLSEYAKKYTNLPDRTIIIPPGYNQESIYPGQKIPKQCFYGSSPDRGLDVLLEAWPKVHAAHPDATLIVTYGGMFDYPGVINLGEVDEETMNDVYRTSDIWCHPCTGIELYCIVGKKAQVAGCIPVIQPAMALKETVQRGFMTTPEHFAETLIGVLNLTPQIRNTIRNDIVQCANATTWEQSTTLLEQVCYDLAKDAP